MGARRPGRSATRCGHWRRWHIAPAALVRRATAAGYRSTSRGGCGPTACAPTCRSCPVSPSRTLPARTRSRRCARSASIWWLWSSRTSIAPGRRRCGRQRCGCRRACRCCRTGWRWSGRACTSPRCRGRRASTRCSATPRGCCRSRPTWSIRCSRRGWRSPTAATRPTRCPPSSACSRSGASPTTARSTPSGGCGWSCPVWGRSRCAERATPRTLTCWWACCSTAVWRSTRCWRCCFRRCSRAARLTATTAPSAGRWRRARPR